MGIFSFLRTVDQVERYATAQPARALATPFAGESHLSPALVLGDIFSNRVVPVTRAEAMSVPAIARARRLVCNILGRQPVKAYRSGGALVDPQPRFLYASKYFPPRLRMVWTLDDLMFNGWSLWALDRGAEDASGRAPILDALRIDPAKWHVEDGKIIVAGPRNKRVELTDGQYLLFPGAQEGLLTMAAGTIRGYLNIERQWQGRMDNPVPITELSYEGDDPLTADEMKDVRRTFLDALKEDGGVVYVTPPGWTVHAHGDEVPDLFVQGRNAAALDAARFAAMPASMLDASQVNGSSIDYENNELGRSSYRDLTLRDWALPVEEALSQDDVLPAGQYVEFDLSALATTDTGTGPALED